MTEVTDPSGEYPLGCPTCMCEFDALSAAWCSCNAHRPTKMCPFCLTCFCRVPGGVEHFWEQAPAALVEEGKSLASARMLFGDILLRAGLITPSELERGLALQKEKGLRFGDALVALGILERDKIDEFLRLQETVVTFDIDDVVLDLSLIQQLGVDLCRAKRILPLETNTFRGQTLLTLAMADPADNETIQLIQRRNGWRVLPGRAPEAAILAALDGSALREKLGC